MATLTELYAKVRSQTDTDSAELPDALLSQYLEEAFNRTIAAENLWPSYEQVWDLTLTAGETTIALPGDVNEPGIIGLWDVANEYRLVLLSFEKGLDFLSNRFSGSAFGPHAYALWAGEIKLFPAGLTFSEDKEYKLYGYRRAAAWPTSSSGSPDCDERLHLALAHYATALAYAREEDEVLERNYMERWQRDVEMARQAIMDANRQRPLVMGPHFAPVVGSPSGTYNPGVVINTP